MINRAHAERTFRISSCETPGNVDPHGVLIVHDAADVAHRGVDQ